MIDVPVVLAGAGPVGRAYLDLVAARSRRWRARYGVNVRVSAVRGRRGQAVPEGGSLPHGSWSPLTDLAAVLREHRARVFVQAVPSSAEALPRAAAELHTALEQGVHVATATKTPLLTAWHDLDRAATDAGCAVRISGATGAALPAGDLARSVLRGFDVEAVEGCPNGTATFVLDRLADGIELPEAIAAAQRLGIAEADPTADLSGDDAATKLRLLAGLLWAADVPSMRVSASPITEATAEEARSAAARGRRLRHVAVADSPESVRVDLRAEAATSPLGGLEGPDKAVTFHCGDAGAITVRGGRSSPHGAALALAKDTLATALDPAVGLR
ncbi:homoserine dehydrogenase [Allosaccharopolyspora coralli]|uniref:homoserine dehydrogenase n=1 Tax=Allosaccharopolyspora coralli TaxID=2665642 RepID=UPI001651F094|nr:homoserine dehydrogenase [Allosaccharopolyspora coralli]